jgi:phosphonoacetate hydrolase
MIPVTVNGRAYNPPAQPLVAVCIDGSEPGYIEAAIAAGRAPFFARILAEGTSRLADCVIPSFTNPNNLSIVTGAPPSMHGISGNYFLDPASGQEVMMNDPALLRAPTIFAAFQAAGAGIAIVTAKDKLRRLLGQGLRMRTGETDDGAICFSAERAGEASFAENGIADVPRVAGLPVPDVYSAALSEFVFAAGLRIVERRRPDITYLSTTDYIQHKHPPGDPVADDFYAMMDGYLGRLDALGAVIAITADHGMNDKHDAAGRPDVIYLQALLDDWLGAGAARVILPITDPYVVHHGALGSFATVYLEREADRAGLVDRLAALPGLEAVLPREAACRRFELPADRIGDIVVISTRHKVIGTTPALHDLSGLDAPLRSHGGLSERRVPLLLNRPVELAVDTALRNFDLFDVALNRLGASSRKTRTAERGPG